MDKKGERQQDSADKSGSDAHSAEVAFDEVKDAILSTDPERLREQSRKRKKKQCP
jgi:hypothetical protein